MNRYVCTEVSPDKNVMTSPDANDAEALLL
jgi:hypothetical protein